MCLIFFLGVSAPARGQPVTLDPSVEAWSGAEAFHRVWSIYTGATLIPAGMEAGGWRLRVIAGQSAYRTSERARAPLGGTTFVDGLLGYQHGFGPITIKAFAGVASSAHAGTTYAQFLARARVGPKAVFEAWWTLNAHSWASLDLAWSAPESAYFSRLRTAVRVTPQISLGLEGGAVGKQDAGGLRFGPFARYEWRDGEVSLSGGWAGEGTGTGLGRSASASANAQYLTLNWLTRY